MGYLQHATFESFVKKYFGATKNEAGKFVNAEGEVLPVNIAYAHYKDYVSSGMTLKSYIKQTVTEIV